MSNQPGMSTTPTHRPPAPMIAPPSSPVHPAGALQQGNDRQRAGRADLHLIPETRAERLAGLRRRIQRGVYYIPDALLARRLLDVGIWV